MKNKFLFLLLGFVLNSSIRTYYNYSWWTTEATVTNKEYNLSIEKYGYAKIIHDKMGIAKHLKYILIYGTYPYKKWEIAYP